MEEKDGGHISWGYHALHGVRYAAAKASGFKGTEYEFVKKELDGTSDTEFPKYRQLMHFTDCDGILVPSGYLKGVNYEKSYKIGSFDEMKNEIIELGSEVLTHPELFSDVERRHIGQLHKMFTYADAYDIVRFH